MDTQTLVHFAHIQMEGAAFSTFHLCSSVPVRHTDLHSRQYKNFWLLVEVL